METKAKNDETSVTQAPKIFVRNLKFNDGTQMTLNHNSIVLFTGPNNCGKSQTLKDVEHYLDKSLQVSTKIVKKCEYDYYGAIDEKAFFSEHFSMNEQGNYKPFEVNPYSTFSKESLQYMWKKHELRDDIHLLFVKRLSTEYRLTSSNALKRSEESMMQAIYKLYKNESLAQKVSVYFRQAFGVDLVIDRSEMLTIPLHTGHAPDKAVFTIDKQDDYYKQVAALPTLQEQGDGMRSFASILLDTFTSEHSITLIDEPEAFLHPPQARMLGKMLAKNNPINRQLLIATHSEDFLLGLLDADNENVTVIRIDRVENINKMSVLNNTEIKKLWNNPLLRYSNILSGLFHEKVIVCESDYDCLFYQAVMNAIFEQKKEISPDVLFTHCGGKARVKDIVQALRAVNVPVVAICDFDVLNSRQTLKPIISSFGLNWDSVLSIGMNTIYNSVNGRNHADNNVWANLKRTGKAGLQGNEPAAYEQVEMECKSAGLFVVPVGELECFDKTINKEKKEWVFQVLENYDLAVEPKIEDARKFVQAVVDYKPIDETCRA